MAQQQTDTITLPPPQREGRVSVEAALAARKSVREFSRQPLTLKELSQLLWGAQGLNRPGGGRTAPSAGALYPLELLVVVGDVEKLRAGAYRYDPHGHRMMKKADGDLRAALSDAALGQDCMADAAVILVLAAVYERTRGKYGERGVRYVHMEVGHSAQNVYLQAAALGLGTTFIGAFYDDRISELLDLRREERALGMMPVGRER